ncbi:MAG: hypothetical protein LBS74_03015 [Oscillospiraceae bacterium]|jgi:hypothetical protein|nr:hypothetical protein [Oscillospiraceae bacterium]
MFTERQINNFEKYERVRRSGQINMWDATNGCKLSGLTLDEYLFVIQNYNELEKAAEEEKKCQY